MDPVDELIMQEAPAEARGALVLDAPALIEPARERWGRVRSYHDVGEPTAGWTELTEADALAEVDLVLLRLPKSLAALEEYAQRIASGCAPGVRLVAGGRVKHMSRGMNLVLERNFAAVQASLGWRKSRVLHAAEPRQTMITFPRTREHEELDLRIAAFGHTFAGPRIDPGTRLLIKVADQLPGPGEAIDLGCGNGVLSLLLARAGHRVTAVDNSRAALASTRAGAELNDLSIMVRRSDGLSGIAEHSADLIVCNPPFHIATTKDSTPARTMLADAARVLRPGGELWAVWNSHLPYLTTLRRVGRTMIMARDSGYLVTRTVLEESPGDATGRLPTRPETTTASEPAAVGGTGADRSTEPTRRR